MKQCKVYSSEKETETAGIIVEGCVLLPASRHDDIEPAYTVDGQCYYPPFYAVDFAKNLHFDLMPFSTECEWGEYADIDSPCHNAIRYWGCDDEYKIKWGYCDTKSGQIRISPEMKYCDAFNEQGAAIVEADLYWLMDTNGEIQNGTYHEIIKSFHGVFLVNDVQYEGWGAVDSLNHDIVEPNWYDIEWDGIGGFTVTHKNWQKDGYTTYGIKNDGFYSSTVVHGLTEKPIIYDFPPEKRRINTDRNDDFYFERFRITQRGDKYGLVRDVVPERDDPASTYSEQVLEPIYDYDEIPDAAYNAWVEQEICYFAMVMAKTPRNGSDCIGDGWDAVPEDIREDVRGYMVNNGMEQPETVGDL